MDTLELHTAETRVRWEDNTSCIYMVEAKIVTHGAKQTYTPVCFLPETIENDLFVPKYEKYSVIPEDMCNKPYSGPIISWGTKWMTGLRVYPSSDTENYQLMKLHEFDMT